MFWKFVVSALLLPSCLGFETAAAHLVNKQNQPQSQESTLPVTSTLANQSLMNSSTLANEEDSSIQSNLEADTAQVKQTKYEYYQRIHQQRLRRYRHRACPDSQYHRRYNQNRVYYPQNHHPRRHYYRYQPQNYHRQHNYRCQYYSHGRCYN
jgi:hypothetical protein